MSQLPSPQTDRIKDASGTAERGKALPFGTKGATRFSDTR
jgi:hypothetical protein